jgi:formylglycine-generating enzyme required for sulfatase activity
LLLVANRFCISCGAELTGPEEHCGGCQPAAAKLPATMAMDALPQPVGNPRVARSATVAISLDALPSGNHPAIDEADSGSSPVLPDPAVRAKQVALREARRKNQSFLRWAPLILLVLVGLVLLLLAALSHSGQAALQTVAPELRATGAPVMVSLGSGEALLGLSENNKDATLQLCWRVSDKPTTECRISYLEAQHEFPSRKIAFPAMTVMATEVSNAQYEACVAAGGCKARALDRCEYHSIFRWEMGQPVPAEMLEPERPAVCVVFEEAEAFCRAQSLRLPTAAEWERVARGNDDRLLPWGRVLTPGLMNWGERDMAGFPVAGRLDGSELTAKVTEFADSASPDGVVNLLGNVAEWVVPRAFDKPGEAGLRGGSYVDDVRSLRSTFHTVIAADKRLSTIGFRCVGGPLTPWPEGSGTK